MPNANLCVFMGNLTRPPELRYTQSGIPSLDFTLAVNRKTSKDKDEACYIDCTIWQKLAESIATLINKGDCVYVSGYMRTYSWEERDTGKKRSQLRLIVDSIQIISSKNKSNNAPEEKNTHRYSNQSQTMYEPQHPAQTPSTAPVNHDPSIPF